MSRKMRMGMVGGGRDAFIGAVHRMAAALDGHIELVCGAFSSDPERSRASGADLYLPANRVYGDFHEMMAAEAKLPAGERHGLRVGRHPPTTSTSRSPRRRWRRAFT